MSVEAFLEACGANDPTRAFVHPDRPTSIYHPTRYTLFARWVTEPPQVGVHLRTSTRRPGDVASRAFRAPHDWVHLPWPGADLAERLDRSRTLAGQAKRGPVRQGPYDDVYRPLARGFARLRGVEPLIVHAGGPRARLGSAEVDCCLALCDAILEHVAWSQRADEARVIGHLLTLGPSLHERAREARSVLAGSGESADESAYVTALRARVGCGLGAKGAPSHAAAALERAVDVLQDQRGVEAAVALLLAADAIVLQFEFTHAAARHVRPGIEVDRVIHRGADSENRPAFWLARRGAQWCLLTQLGSRWSFVEGDRDDVLATVPEAWFGEAVARALES